MRDRLAAYVDLLFAGNPEAEDVKQEILQNTLDKFDDLVAQGRSPEAAYSLAISGIGDVSELLGGNTPLRKNGESPVQNEETEEEQKKRKLLKSIAVGLYILCPVPLFLFENQIGLCLLLTLVAIATVLMTFAGKNNPEAQAAREQMTPEKKLRSSVRSAVWTVGLVCYFILSFLTGAWHLTWLIFPITGAVSGLVTAIMDLREAR